MKPISFLFAAGLATACFAQSSLIAQGSVYHGNFNFHWQSRLEPPSPPLAENLGYASGFSDGSIYRVMIDKSRRVYFGYQVRVEPLPRSTYRLSFQPLNLNADTLKRIPIDDASWKKLDLGPPVGRPVNPLGQGPDIVAELDVVKVDLMMNPDTQQKIVDYFVLQQVGSSWSFNQLDALQQQFSFPSGDPRDFAVEDANMRIAQPRLSINGKSEQIYGVDDISSSVMWLYVPNHGRYILTIAPHPEAGFRKSGEVRGNTLSLTAAGDKFTINCAKPIASGDAAFNLYVLQDASWKPTYANAATGVVIMGTADKELLDFLGRAGYKKAQSPLPH